MKGYWRGRCPIHDQPWWMCDLDAGWPVIVMVLVLAAIAVRAALP